LSLITTITVFRQVSVTLAAVQLLLVLAWRDFVAAGARAETWLLAWLHKRGRVPLAQSNFALGFLAPVRPAPPVALANPGATPTRYDLARVVIFLSIATHLISWLTAVSIGPAENLIALGNVALGTFVAAAILMLSLTLRLVRFAALRAQELAAPIANDEVTI
tara:strand:- start:70 stop:558 length:489 start_codon:yes stop_codon:yes gene_type:complete